MYVFLGRISRSYSDLSGMFFEWSKQCEFIWVYQHDADEKVSRTHCHILVIGSARDVDGLKKLVSWKQLNIDKGNKGSSFKEYKKLYDDFRPEGSPTWYKSLAYYSKGRLDPMLANGANANETANQSKNLYENHDNKQATANVVIIEKKNSSRVTQFQIAEMAQQMYIDEYQEKFVNDNGTMCVRKLIKIVIQLLKQNKILCHKRLVANVVQHIRASLEPSRFIEEVYQMV